MESFLTQSALVFLLFHTLAHDRKKIWRKRLADSASVPCRRASSAWTASDIPPRSAKFSPIVSSPFIRCVVPFSEST